MALDLSILKNALQRQYAYDLPGDYFQQMLSSGLQRGAQDRFGRIVEEELQKEKPSMARMLSGQARVDPAAAMAGFGRKQQAGDRLSVFEKKAALTQTPEAIAVANKWQENLNKMQERVKNDPFADISDLKAANIALEREYKNITQQNIATFSTSDFVKGLNQRAKTAEGMQNAVMSIAEKASQMDETLAGQEQRVRGAVSQFRGFVDPSKIGVPSSLGSLGEQKQAAQETYNLSALNSAVKAFVSSIDNSVVMKGEIGQILSRDVESILKSFGQKLLGGSEYTGDEVINFLKAALTAAKEYNKRVDKRVKSMKTMVNKASNIYTSRIPDISEQQKSQLSTSATGVATSMLDGLKINLGNFEAFVNAVVAKRDELNSDLNLLFAKAKKAVRRVTRGGLGSKGVMP